MKIINQNDRIEAYRDNVMVGYVEDDTLFAVDHRGYASEVGAINHRVEIETKLNEWRNSGR